MAGKHGSTVALMLLSAFQVAVSLNSNDNAIKTNGCEVQLALLQKEIQDLKNLLNVVLKQAKQNEITYLTKIQSVETELKNQADDLKLAKQSETTSVAKISAMEIKIQSMEMELKKQMDDIKQVKGTEKVGIAKLSALETELNNQANAIIQGRQSDTMFAARLSALEAELRNQTDGMKQANQTGTTYVAKLNAVEIKAEQMKAEMHTIMKKVKILQNKDNRSEVEQQDMKTQLSHYTNVSETQYKLFEYQIGNCGAKQQILETQLGKISKAAGNKPIIKQITWDTEDDNDEGIIKSIVVPRTRNDSMIKVTYGGNLWTAYKNGNRCSRWWFTFNDAECSIPSTIDAVLLLYSTTHPYSTVYTTVSGICYGIPRGNIRIDFHVGKCLGHSGAADAYTGYESVSRIIVEEI